MKGDVLIRKIICAICGKEFEVNQCGRIVYCGDECRAEAIRIRQRNNYKDTYCGSHKSWEYQKETARKEAKAREARRKNQKELTNIAVKARALGMSYGKYVAMMEMNGRGM